MDSQKIYLLAELTFYPNSWDDVKARSASTHFLHL